MARGEIIEAFPCFGSTCGVLVIGDGELGSAVQAVDAARACLESWHRRFTRFDRDSELSRLNADPRPAVEVTPIMARFAAAAVAAAEWTGGLVDPTLLADLERAGYTRDLRASLPLDLALRLAPRRRAGGPSPDSRWREITVEHDTVIRPPGVTLDSRRHRQGPVRRRARRAARLARELRRRLRGRPARRRAAGPAEARQRREPVRRRGPARVRARRRRRRDERDRQAQLARRARRARAPPARPRDGPPRVHRRRPGDGDRADRPRGRAARQGRGAERPRREPLHGCRTAGWSCTTTAATSSTTPSCRSPTPRSPRRLRGHDLHRPVLCQLPGASRLLRIP